MSSANNIKTMRELLDICEQAEVRVRADGDELVLRYAGELPPGLRQDLRAHKPALLEYLRNEREMITNQASVEIVRVTPDLARVWLRQNDGNRPLSLPTVERYARILSSGGWMLSCDAVGFDVNGRLVNGQHRLHAILKSEQGADMVVVSGLPEEVFEVLDTNKRRSASDSLAILGYSNYTTLAASARLLLNAVTAGALSPTTWSVSRENSDIVKCVEDHPGLSDSVAFVRQYASQLSGVVSISALAFLHYIYAQQHPVEASSFVEQVALGANLRVGDPALAFRDRMFRASRGKTKLKREEELALHIIALNAHVRRRKAKIIRWSPGGNQPYPQPCVPLPAAAV